MIDRGFCWRPGCRFPADYLTDDVVAVALCLCHAAEIAAEVTLIPIEARVDRSHLVRRDLPRSPA